MKKLIFFLSCILYGQTAQFPGAITTDQQLGVVGNGVTGTLNNTVSVNATNIVLKNGTCTRNGVATSCITAFQANMFITLDSEIMQICSLSALTSTTTLQLGNIGSSCPSINGRGLDGSTKVAHNTLTSLVRNNIIAWNTNAANKEIEAAQKFSIGGAINVKTFGAVGDNTTDDTIAIQACIDYSIANRVTCSIPGGLYKITGSPALTIGSSAASLYGLVGIGNAAPCFVYNGTGTALNITNGSTLIYGISLINICIVVADGYSATAGINTNLLSQSNWQGITIANQGTGKFTTGIRFKDTGLLRIRGMEAVAASYVAGTTGILFDEFGSYGNDEIYISNGGVGNQEHALDFKSCSNCLIRDTYFENDDYFIWIDNTVAWSANSGFGGLTFSGNKFSTVGTGASNHKILKVTSTTGNLLNAGLLTFNQNQMYLGTLGGISYPLQLNISSMAAGSNIRLVLRDNNIPGGVKDALVDCNSTIGKVSFSNNLLYDYTGAGTKTPVFHGTCQSIDSAPEDINHSSVNWVDQSGELYLSGHYTNAMTRPTVGNGVSGVISGVDIDSVANGNGFLRIGVANAAIYNSYCDFFGYNTSTTLDRTVSCFVQDTLVFKLDPSGAHIGSLNILSENGANNAITSPSNPANPSLVSGLVVTVVLAHTLRAGANTFGYNGGAALSIKSSLNGSNDIGTAYGAGGVITLFYNGSYWQDLKQ